MFGGRQVWVGAQLKDPSKVGVEERYPFVGGVASSLNDIERAAGLAVGSGGTYRHFKSKDAILEAAVEDLLSELHARLDPTPTSIEAGFRASLDFTRENRLLLRILTRDLDAFPDLRRSVIDELLEHQFRLAADRTEAIAPHLDVEAVAAVVGSAAVGFTLLEALADWKPLGVSDERFIDVLSSVYLHLLTSEAT